MSKSKNKYYYFPIISENGGITKMLSIPDAEIGFNTFNQAWEKLKSMILLHHGNYVDFAGVIKSQEGENPFNRINGLR